MPKFSAGAEGLEGLSGCLLAALNQAGQLQKHLYWADRTGGAAGFAKLAG
jgi:hypothetical protein